MSLLVYFIPFICCFSCVFVSKTKQMKYMTVSLGIRLKSMSVRSWRWTSLRLPRTPRITARVLLIRANLSFFLVGYDRCIWLSAFFSYLFCQSFVDSWILVPSLRLLWRQGYWMKTSLCQSLYIIN